MKCIIRQIYECVNDFSYIFVHVYFKYVFISTQINKHNKIQIPKKEILENTVIYHNSGYWRP
jgi:hypothetical protein